MTRFFFSALVLIFLVIVQKGSSLQCWTCSSDLDPQCRDPFNTTEILRYGGGGSGSFYQNQQNFNNNPQQNYNGQQNYNQQRNYDANNPSSYPRDYNQQNNRQGFNQGFGNQPGSTFTRSNTIHLMSCNEDDARLRRMRNVCIKKVQKNPSNIYSVIRRCEMVAFDRAVGTCDDPVARGISLEFCEYCEYDGCNSATGLKMNFILASLIPVVIFLFFRK